MGSLAAGGHNWVGCISAFLCFGSEGKNQGSCEWLAKSWQQGLSAEGPWSGNLAGAVR